MQNPGTSAYEQGLAALRGGAAAQAVLLLSQAAEADPRHADSSAMLGVALGQQGRYAEAAQSLRRALALQPGNPVYHYNLGMALEAGGDRAGAAAAYRAALGINPNYLAAQTRLRALGPLPPPAPPRPAAPPVQPAPPRSTPAAPPQGWGPTAGSGSPGVPPPAPIPAPPPAQAVPYTHLPSSGYAYPVGMVGTGMTTGDAFGRRLAGRVVDGLISLAVVGVLLGLGMGLGLAVNPTLGAAVLVLWYVVASIGPLVYICWMQAKRGQTIGQKAMGIRLVAADGRTPNAGVVIARQVLQFIFTGIFLLGAFWMLWDPRQQTWHDKLTDTYVVRG